MRRILPLCFVLLAWAGSAAGQPRDPSRGALLYSTHCIACHTEQMHWRTLRRARDWDTLKAQVRRWQGEQRLQWSEEDIEAVAAHLNDTIYRFPRPDGQASRPGTPLANASSRH